MPLPIAAIIAAAATLGSAGVSAYGASKQRKAQEKSNEPYLRFQDRKNQLIDELLSSLDGTGKYADLFSTDEGAFQKSFVDPAKQMFRDQITPQIQQGSIAGGTQRSTSMDDQLTRAGVDLDQLLNQSYSNFQSEGKDRASNLIGNIFGAPADQPMTAGPNSASLYGSAAGSFFGSDSFTNLIKEFGKKPPTQPGGISDWNRPGFK
ncbi:unnamed protein product, partial [marine sediment metagenome]